MQENQKQVILRSGSDRAFDIALAVICGLIFISVLYPLYFVVLASFSDPIQVAGGKVWLWTTQPTLDGYKKVFEYEKLWVGYRNTIVYALVGVAAHMLVTIPAAYALSRKDAMLRGPIMMLFTITMFFGGGMIPTYLLVKNLGMLNTVWALVLPGAISTWNLIITRTFISSSIPDELQEAAQIDGCNNARFFVSIVLPNSSTIIAVIGLFYAVDHWLSYWNAMLYITKSEMYPLQLVLRDILLKAEVALQNAQSGTDLDGGASIVELLRISESVKYIVVIAGTLPLLIVFPFVEKYFVKGVMIGSVKG